MCCGGAAWPAICQDVADRGAGKARTVRTVRTSVPQSVVLRRELPPSPMSSAWAMFLLSGGGGGGGATRGWLRDDSRFQNGGHRHGRGVSPLAQDRLAQSVGETVKFGASHGAVPFARCLRKRGVPLFGPVVLQPLHPPECKPEHNTHEGSSVLRRGPGCACRVSQARQRPPTPMHQQNVSMCPRTTLRTNGFGTANPPPPFAPTGAARQGAYDATCLTYAPVPRNCRKKNWLLSAESVQCPQLASVQGHIRIQNHLEERLLH